MAIKLQLRNPDGTYTRGSLVNAEKAFKTFGSNVIKGGRKILNQKKKRAKGTLFNDFHYTLNVKGSSMDMGFRFGKAQNYWEFVDEGVKGSGGFKGSGRMRGQGSPFSFKTKQPPLNAILSWVKLKGLSGKSQKGIAFAIARTIKQRGLERTQFFTRPLNEQLEKLDKDILSGFAKDVDKLLNNMPEKLVVITDK